GAIAVVVFVVGLGAAARHGGGLSAGEARLTVSGHAEVALKGKTFKTESGSRTLRPGDRIRVVAGTARITLADGGRLELRMGSALRFDSPPFVEAGDLLIEPAKHALAVATDGASAQVDDGA